MPERIASSIMGRPLLDLDFGVLMGEGGGVMGSAAMSMRRALAIAHLLNSMQEQQDVFVFGIADDVRQLAPEQIRQGVLLAGRVRRLPKPADRAAIFKVHLA